jgi:hypothetical protein
MADYRFRPEDGDHIASCLQFLYQLPNKELWRWQAAISLVIDRFQWIPVSQTLPSQGIQFLHGSQRIPGEPTKREIQECLQILYKAPDEELRRWQGLAFSYLDRFRVLPAMKSLPSGKLSCYRFLSDLKRELGLVEAFFDDDRSYLIFGLRKKGDPRVAAVTNLPRTASYELLFLFTLGVRHLIRTYRETDTGTDRDRLPDPGSRVHGQTRPYAAKCGLSAYLDRIAYALQIGRKQDAIEQGVNLDSTNLDGLDLKGGNLSGVSLVMTPVSRKLNALLHQEVDKVILLLTIFDGHQEIALLAYSLTSDMNSYQRIFDSEVANWLELNTGSPVVDS